jgi:endonuclease/exonuclease/phosphatase (EEP) superfamily protein YafD
MLGRHMRSPPGKGEERVPWFARLSLVALGSVVAASVAAWLAPLGWPFELFVHFRPQYAAAAALLALALLALRRPRPAVLAALITVIHLWSAGSGPQAVASAACRGDALTVVTANLNYRNTDPRAFVAWLTREQADLVMLQELTPAWAAALESLPGYPHRQFVVRPDPYGIGVLSRWPVGDLVARDLARDGLPSLIGTMEAGRERLMLAVVHTHWPLLPDLMHRRDLAVSQLAAEVRRQPGPWIVGGDFNLTPYSPVFQRLLEMSGLRETRPRGSWSPSWRAGFWPLGLRIDHVLVTRELCSESSEVGPEIGSDHRPVRVRLRGPG